MLEYEHEVCNNYNEKNTSHNLSPDLIKSINKIIQSEEYLTYSIHVKYISTEGGNYLSILWEVDIKGKTDITNKQTNLFIKQSLQESDSNLIRPKVLFLKEIFVYTELGSLLTEFQNEFNLPDKERYELVKCYSDDQDSSLIFDNMTRIGFKTYCRFEAMPLKAMILSVKQLAKFHAFSEVLKHYKPDFYKNKIQNMKHPFLFDDNSVKFIKMLSEISLKYLEDDRKTKVEKYLSGLITKYYRYLHENERKFKCLCHGDYRMNNILVKEKKGEAVMVIPVDFQVVYYGSPVTDLLYLIFISTDQQFRKDNMEVLKNEYYESFTKFLRYFNIDVESVYGKEEFEEDFENQLDYGFIVTLTVLPFVLAAEDDIPEINNEFKTMKMDDRYKPRLEGIIDDFIEWGIL